jgi:hypothetical protein
MATATEKPSQMTTLQDYNALLRPIINGLFSKLSTYRPVKQECIVETLEMIANANGITLENLKTISMEMIIKFKDTDYKYINRNRMRMRLLEKACRGHIIDTDPALIVFEPEMQIIWVQFNNYTSDKDSEIIYNYLSCLGLIYIEYSKTFNGAIVNLPHNVIQIVNDWSVALIECIELPKYLKGLEVYTKNDYEMFNKIHEPLKYLVTRSHNLHNLPPVESLHIFNYRQEDALYYNTIDGIPQPIFTSLQYGMKTLRLDGVFIDEFATLPPSIEKINIKYLYSALRHFPISLKVLDIYELYIPKQLFTPTGELKKKDYIKPECISASEKFTLWGDKIITYDFILADKPGDIQFNENLEELHLNSYNLIKRIVPFITVLPKSFKKLYYNRQLLMNMHNEREITMIMDSFKDIFPTVEVVSN